MVRSHLHLVESSALTAAVAVVLAACSGGCLSSFVGPDGGELARGLSQRELRVLPFCYLGLKLDDPQGAATMKAILESHKPVLVILDSLIRFHSHLQKIAQAFVCSLPLLRRQ